MRQKMFIDSATHDPMIERYKQQAREAIMKSPSDICREMHVQKCYACENADCGDNQTPSIVRLKEELKRLREAK